MGCNTFFNGSFFDDIDVFDNKSISQFITKKTDAALSFPSTEKPFWFPKIIRKDKLIKSTYKQVLIRSSFQNKYLPYECEPQPESKYSDEIQLNIDNCSSLPWELIDEGSPEWLLKDKSSGETYKKYSAVCGEPAANRHVFANYADILPQIPTLNNNYVNSGSLYDNYPHTNEYPAYKVYDGIGIQEFFRYFAPTKNMSTHPPIVIDWIISEKLGEIPFDGIETHHTDITTHNKSYQRFLQTNKTCGNFISLDFIAQNSGVVYLTKDILPDIDDFTIPYGNKQPSINNIFIGKEKVASNWNWTYEEAVLCWYRYNPSSDVIPAPSQLGSPNHEIYVSDGDVFIAKNIDPIRVLKNNIIQYTLPTNGKYLYISHNIYSKFIKILERLENKNPSFAILKPDIKVQTAALYATGPSYDEITLDTIEFSDVSASINDIYSNYGFRGNQINKNNIQNFLDLNSKTKSFEDTYINSSTNDLLSITNFVMEDLFKSTFKHDQQLNKLNYATNLPELITVLNHKYGSYISCTAATNNIVFTNKPDQVNIAVDLDIEVLMKPENSATIKQLSCGSFKNGKIIGYNQQIKINNHILSTNLDEPLYNKSCISGKFTITEIGRPINLNYAELTLDQKILTTGSPQTIYEDIYYRGSYDLALIIDGETLCQNSKICDQKLKDKYYPTYKDEDEKLINDDVKAIEFVNNDVKKTRIYNRVLCNPNIALIGMQNDTIYTESNIFNDETYVSPKKSVAIAPEIKFNIIDNSCIVKIHNIHIPYLRSVYKPQCKTIPIKNRCKCHAINVGFSYSCGDALERNIVYPQTPDIRTNIPLYVYDRSSQYVDYSRQGLSLSSGMLPLLDRYYDPFQPYECSKEFSVSLPIYTRTDWQLDFSNFKYDNQYGDLWVNIVNTGHDRNRDRNQIEARFGGESLYPNQWRKISNPTTFSLINPFLTKALDSEDILYKPLPCATGENNEQIDTVKLTFKYIPHKHILSFGHSRSTKDLKAIELIRSNTFPISAKNSDLVYDEELFTVKNISQQSENIRVYGRMTSDQLNLLSLAKNLDNSTINIYLLVNNSWFLYRNAKFGYNIDKKTYLGYPTMYEDSSPYVGKKIPSVLSSYVLNTVNNFIYKVKTEFSNVFYDTDYFNYLKSYDLSTYFLCGYQQSFSFNSNIFLENYNNQINFYPTNDILLSKEFCYSPIILSTTIDDKVVEHKTKILNKYLYMDSSNGYKYALFRLIPYNKNNVFDYADKIRNPVLKTEDTLCITLNKEINRPIYNELDNLLEKTKWSDVYGYNHYKSFDITNRIDQIYSPPSLAYDNIWYQLALYYNYYLLSYNKIFDTKLVTSFGNINLSEYKLKNNIKYHLHSTSNIKYDKSLVDYKYPFVDLFFDLENKNIIKTLKNNAGIISFKDVRLIDENYLGSEDIIFWLDLAKNTPLELEPIFTDSNSQPALSEGFKIHEPPYILASNNYQIIDYSSDLKCTNYISPDVSVGYRNAFVSATPSNKVASIEYKPKDQRDIYCNSDFIEECNTVCSIIPTRAYRYNSNYVLKSYDTKTVIFDETPTKVYFTAGNGSFYNYPYIVRTQLNSQSLQNNYIPNLTPDGDLINDNVMMISEEELYKKYPYGTNNLQQNTVLAIDAIANEMLFGLYYGSININLETIGKKDIRSYHQDQKLLSFKNLIETNTTILPEEIYKLIPYEYDQNTTSNLHYNGTLNIQGIPKAGHSIVLTINNKSYNIQLTQLDDGIYVIIDGKKALYKKTKIISKGLHSILRGSGATVVPTRDTTYSMVGTCFVYGGKQWFPARWVTQATVNGYDIGSLYDACISAGPGDPLPEGIDLVVTPRACCWGACIEAGCDNHGVGMNPPENIAASKEYKVSFGGRGTFPTNLCIGTERIEGACGVVSSRLGSLSLSPVFRRGSIDSLGGGVSPRDPRTIFPNCGFSGCGNLCLSKQYSDKYGDRPYLNNKRVAQFGDGHPGFSPCECMPVIAQPCTIPDDSCYICTETDSELFNYSYEYGKYKYNNMRGIAYRQISSEQPKLIKQLSYNPSVSLCTGLNWSAINQESIANGTEVCGFTESVYPNFNYDIYESTTTTYDPAEFKCPENIISINYTNNNIIFTISRDETTSICFDVDHSGCPNINLKLPDTSYYIDNNINSECLACEPQTNKLKLVNEKQEWKTIVQERVGILGYLLVGQDINNILVVGGQTYYNKQECGAVPDPNACYERPYGSVATTIQCGKQSSDSYPWRYCINCRILGSNNAKLVSIQGGTALEQYTYGGVVTDCIPVSLPPEVSPQFPDIKEKYIEEWKTKMRYKYLDVHPCHNNTKLNEEDIIEGVLSCEDIEFTTVTYPGLAYRRTSDGAESSGFTLEVLVAFYRYSYKRPVTVDDELIGDYYCDTYNIGGGISGPPRLKPNIVEKYVNDGPCTNEITCGDTNVEQCDNTNYCCRTNISRG